MASVQAQQYPATEVAVAAAGRMATAMGGAAPVRITVPRAAERTTFFLIGVSYPTIEEHCSVRYRACWPPEEGPAYLRLERRGDWLTLLVSEDGKAWQRAQGPFSFRGFQIPQRLKIGVVAEATAEATFKAVFDNFKLTPLSGKSP
jgi:hypothetical protein